MYVLASHHTNECEPIALEYYDSESGALGVMIGTIFMQTNDESSSSSSSSDSWSSWSSDSWSSSSDGGGFSGGGSTGDW